MVSRKPAIQCLSVFSVCAGLMWLPGTWLSATQAPLVEEGAAIYAERCSGCHGENLNNVSGGWSFDLQRLHADEHDRFVDSVTTGKDICRPGTRAAIDGGMKPEAWKKLFATRAAVEQMGASFWQPRHEHQPFALFIARKAW